MRYRVCQKLTGFFRRQTSALVDPALDPVLEIEEVLKSYSREQCLCWRWFVAYRYMKQVAVSVTMALKPAENHCQKQLSAPGCYSPDRHEPNKTAMADQDRDLEDFIA